MLLFELTATQKHQKHCCVVAVPEELNNTTIVSEDFIPFFSLFVMLFKKSLEFNILVPIGNLLNFSVMIKKNFLLLRVLIYTN